MKKLVVQVKTNLHKIFKSHLGTDAKNSART